jgi:hypothetical protein
MCWLSRSTLAIPKRDLAALSTQMVDVLAQIELVAGAVEAGPEDSTYAELARRRAERGAEQPRIRSLLR